MAPSGVLLLLTLGQLVTVTSGYQTCYDACISGGKSSTICGNKWDPDTADECCDVSGADATYLETLTSTMRSIATNGCPDHEYYLVNPNVAAPTEETHTVPAYPQLVSLASAKSLSAVGGTIGVATNGVSLYSCYGGASYGECTDWASSAVYLEGSTFDMCGGHSTGFNQYHYHVPPTCLLNALGETSTAHSPQIGWSFDGFPIYGGRGPNGAFMKQEGYAGADATYFLDSCGGYEGALPDTDDYLYRYYIGGATGDGTSNPLDNLPDESFFPHAPICLRGCCPNGETCSGFPKMLANCDSLTTTAGYSAGFQPTTLTSPDSTPSSCSMSANAKCGDGATDPNAQCCDDLTCFRKSASYGQCKAACPTGLSWDCDTSSSTPPPTPTPPAPSTSSSKPNIVLINADDLYSHFISATSSYAAPEPPTLSAIARGTASHTPNLNKLASEGAIFSSAYSSSSMCSPSRYSLLTGRYPSRGDYGTVKSRQQYGSGRTYVSVPWTYLEGNDITENLPTALGECGYKSGAVGKWHLTQGVDYNDAYGTATDSVKERGFDYADGIYVSNLNTCGTECDSWGPSHNLEWQTEKALAFMNATLADDDPFFLYFNPTPPHTPLVNIDLDTNPQPLYTPAGTLATAPDTEAYCGAGCAMPERSAVWDKSFGFSGKSRSDIAATVWVDYAVGVLYNFLESKGVLDNTLIVFTGDNGFAKGSAMELGLSVPMIARGDGIAAGSVVENLVSFTDVAPTFMELAGVSGTYETDGTSFLGLMKGDDETGAFTNRVIYGEIATARAAIRQDGMKLIEVGDVTNNNPSAAVSGLYPAFFDDALYDLGSDEVEQVNVIGETAFAAALVELGAKLDEHDVATVNNVVEAGSTSVTCAAAATGAPTAAPAETDAPTATPPVLTGAPTADTVTGAPTKEPAPEPTEPPADVCLAHNARCGAGASDPGATCCGDEQCFRKSSNYGYCKKVCPSAVAVVWDCEPAVAEVVVRIPATVQLEIEVMPDAGSAEMLVLAGGLKAALESIIGEDGAVVQIISIGGVAVSRRLEGGTEVVFEVSYKIECDIADCADETPTVEEAAALSASVLVALVEATNGAAFAEVLTESMEATAEELVAEGKITQEEADAAAVVEIAVGTVVVEEAVIGDAEIVETAAPTSAPTTKDDASPGGFMDYLPLVAGGAVAILVVALLAGYCCCGSQKEDKRRQVGNKLFKDENELL